MIKDTERIVYVYCQKTRLHKQIVKSGGRM